MDALRPLLAASPRALIARMGLDQHALYVASLLMAATGRPLDVLYSRLGGITGPFFPHGWGDLNIVKLEEDLSLISTWPPQGLKLDFKLLEEGTRNGTPFKRYEASFKTPCIGRIWDALPPESRQARMQLLVPAQQQCAQELAGVVHLAATGDQGFDRRLRLGAPLLQQGIASLVLESPYYGARRPPSQSGSKLRFVSDLLALGWATIYESLHLLHWMEEEGYGRRGITGLSMGGVHACMTAGLYPRDAACTPLLAPRSAAVAYCDGAMQPVTAWQPLLEPQADSAIPALVAEAARAVHSMREASVALELLQQEMQQLKQGEQGQQQLPPQQQRPQQQQEQQGQQQGRMQHTACGNGSSGGSRSDSSMHGHQTSGQQQSEGSSGASSQAATGQQPIAATLKHAGDACMQGTMPSNAASSSSSSSSGTASNVSSHAANDGSAAAAGSTAHAAPSHPSAADVEEAEHALVALMLSYKRGAKEQQRAFRRLKQVLEIYTDVTRYPRPQRPDAAVLVAAAHDAYVAVESVKQVHEYWPGSELRLLDGGHVSAFLLHQNHFRQAIVDSLARL